MKKILDVQALDAGYGDISVLRGVSLHAYPSEIISIVGANGAGKTTLLLTLAGLIKPTSGEVRFLDEDITEMPAYLRPHHRLSLVAEGGRLFPFMTVQENLRLGAYPQEVRASRDQRMEEVFEIFPILKERRTQFASHLSGGERQMCAIARAMMSNPTLLMLDEPSVGLSPLITYAVFDAVKLLVQRGGLTVLLVEQNVGIALEIADRGYVLDHGAIVYEGAADKLINDPVIKETYMGL
jgi:branched-chain amino acid transport system ATP-binding protein